MFNSFKAVIANAMSSFKWMKKVKFNKNIHLSNSNIWLTEHLPRTLINFSGISFGFKLASARVYTVTAADGLNLR